MSAVKMKGPFLDAESDEEDDIPTDTTAESDQEKVYPVDKILAERVNDDGETRYLLLWEGFSLDRATWEHTDNIESEDLFTKWDVRKRRIAAGEETPFDMEEFERVAAQMFHAKAERIRRRRAKRTRRGLVVDLHEDSLETASSKQPSRKRLSVDSSDDENHEQPIKAVKKIRKTGTKAPSPQRKGLAQRVTTGQPKRVIHFGSDESSGDDGREREAVDSDDMADLFHADLPSSQSSSGWPPVTSAPSTNKPNTSVPNNTQPLDTSKAPPVKTSAPAAVVRKPASTATAKHTKPKQPVFGDTKKDAERWQRARVSDKTPKNNTKDSKFKTLSTQRRFQLRSRNEPPPNPDALIIIDPKTGKVVPQGASSVSTTSAEIATSATSPKVRTSAALPPTPAPPPAESFATLAERRRSLEDTTRQVSSSPRVPTAVMSSMVSRQPSTSSPPPAQEISRRPSGDIARAYRRRPSPPQERRCRTPSPPSTLRPQRGPKYLTCLFWLKHHYRPDTDLPCRNGDSCEFSHADTNHYTSRTHNWLHTVQPIEQRDREQRDREQREREQHEREQREKERLENNARPEHDRPPSRAPLFSKQQNDMASKARQTCYFWAHYAGRCKRGAACDFAHHNDTDRVAEPPGSFSRRNFDFRGVDGRPSPPSESPFTLTSANAEPILPRPRVQTDIHEDTLVGTPTAASAELSTPGSAFPFLATPTDYRGPPARAPPSDPRLRGRPSAASNVIPMTLNLLMSKTPVSIDVNLDMNEADIAMWRSLLPEGTPENPELQVGELVLLEELSKHSEFLDSKLSPGDLLPANPEAAQYIDNLAGIYEKYHLASIASYELFTMVIYSSAGEVSAYLDTKQPAIPKSRLRFRICPPTANLRKQVSYIAPPAGPDPCDDAQQEELARVLREADSASLVPNPHGRTGERGAIVIMPDDHQTEMNAIAEYLRSRGCIVTVVATSDLNDWETFRHHYRGEPSTVIVHRKTDLSRLTGLHALLTRSGKCNVFSFGVQMIYDEMMLAHAKSVYSCERFFPLGDVAFITDDVFTRAPKKALAMIDHFLERNKDKPVGGETGKIVTRPSVKTWIYDLTTKKTDGTPRSPEDPDFEAYGQIYEALSKLDDTISPHKSHLISKNASDPQWWWMHGLWDKDPELYTDMMVQWFARWCEGPGVTRFRRMFVCHEPKDGGIGVIENGKSVIQKPLDPRGWAQKYHHIGYLRPEEWMKKKRETLSSSEARKRGR